MSGSGGPKQGEGSELDILLLAGGILFGLWLVYFFFHTEIVRFLFLIKYNELRVLHWFIPDLAMVSQPIQQGYAHPDQVSLSELLSVSDQVGNILKYPFILVSGLLAIVLYFSHPDRLYADFEDMPSLGQKMVKNFPAIQVVQGLDLVNTPTDKGPWAMAKTPIEWAMANKLLSRDPATQSVIVDRLRAKLVFSHQLGPRWKGFDFLAPYEKAIFIAFAAFMNYQREEGEAFLEQLASSATQENLKTVNLNWTGIDALTHQYLDTPIVRSVLSQHAYVYTVFAEMLKQARTSGIVANSLYLWLKPIDRRLWYVLNSVGRKAMFVEVGGIFAHWLTESQLRMPISEPMVEAAVNGLEEAVKIRVIKGI